MHRRHLAAATFALIGLATCGSATSSRAASACTGSVGITFKTIPGSAGMGHISYKLVLRNTSSITCFVTGLPTLRLLDAKGKALPTKAAFEGMPGMLSAVMVPLAPGKTAIVTARFTPDVPGAGEPETRQCEPTAYSIRVATSGGAHGVGRIVPPTPVCQHGAMQISVLHDGA